MSGVRIGAEETGAVPTVRGAILQKMLQSVKNDPLRESGTEALLRTMPLEVREALRQ